MDFLASSTVNPPSHGPPYKNSVEKMAFVKGQWGLKEAP